jgi:dTDP-4-amino-4,6-dideoxygalactose transaminase
VLQIVFRQKRWDEVGLKNREVPFFNYPALFVREKKAYMEALEDVLSRGAYIMQRDLYEFEENLAGYLGVKHAIGAADGTMSLLMSLMAVGVKSGDEVIVPSHTFVASASAIHHAGATPVLVDCGEDHIVTVEAIESALSGKTKAIMPVQLNGRVAEMDGIMDLARRNGLQVVEDACQALGASYKGTFAGTWGDAGAFSFYPSKTLGTFGDAGAVVTNSDEIASKIRLLRDHGRADVDVKCWGFNARMDNIHAAVLKLKFGWYQQEVERRRELAQIYHSQLSDVNELLLPPAPAADKNHFDIFQNYEIEAERRDELMRYLEDSGIRTIKQWGGKLIHQYSDLTDKIVGNVEYSDRMVDKFMLLPMNTSLSDEDVVYVCENVRAFYAYA